MRRYELKRVLYWWWMCRVPLTDAFRAARENMYGFEYDYYRTLKSRRSKMPRLRIFAPRHPRKVRKAFEDRA